MCNSSQNFNLQKHSLILCCTFTYPCWDLCYWFSGCVVRAAHLNDCSPIGSDDQIGQVFTHWSDVKIGQVFTHWSDVQIGQVFTHWSGLVRCVWEGQPMQSVLALSAPNLMLKPHECEEGLIAQYSIYCVCVTHTHTHAHTHTRTVEVWELVH